MIYLLLLGIVAFWGIICVVLVDFQHWIERGGSRQNQFTFRLYPEAHNHFTERGYNLNESPFLFHLFPEDPSSPSVLVYQLDNGTFEVNCGNRKEQEVAAGYFSHIPVVRVPQESPTHIERPEQLWEETNDWVVNFENVTTSV